MQGSVASPGTLVGHEDPPRAVIPPALSPTWPLRVSLFPGAELGFPPVADPWESTLPDGDAAAMPTASSCDRPSWGPWLQRLR